VSDHARFVAPARLIALLTACSRVLGLLRECAYSYFFGIEPIFSSFRVAFMVPNLGRRLFGEGAMASAFIPVFTEVLHKSGRDRGRELAGATFTLLGTVLIGLTLLVEIGLGVGHLARPSITLVLTMLMLPYMILICLTGFGGGMLNALNRFGAPAAAPILLNVVLIAVLLVGGGAADLSKRVLLYVVAVAVVIAGVAQFAVVATDARRAGFTPRWNLRWRDSDLRRIVVMMGPMVVGLSALQLNVLADSLIALAFVPDGRGPAVLGYAHMLYHLPQGVFGIALATAIFPLFAARAAEDDRTGLAQALESGLRMSAFVALPAALGLILLATPVVSALYERRGGEFDAVATGHVARTLLFYALGMVAYCSQPILTRAAYALQDVKTPLRIGLVTVGLNLVLSLVLVFPMAEAGIALATALAASIHVAWLGVSLSRRLPDFQWGRLAGGVTRTLLATAGMSVFLWWVCRPGILGWANSIALLLVAVPAGVVVFALGAKLLGCVELTQLLSRHRDASQPGAD
jgi:putative peptidoglycan lipid II flippase